MNRIKVTRAIKNINQGQLALMIGYSQAMVSLWESSVRTPTQEQKELISRALNFPIEQLWPQHEEGNEREQ